MRIAPVQQSTPAAMPQLALQRRWYSILGIQVSVASDISGVLERVDETYIAFRQGVGMGEPTLVVQSWRLDDGGFLVCDSRGYERRWPGAHEALLDTLERIVHGVLAGLQSEGVYAIHAGATVYRGEAVAVAGRSGQGKTTLVLGLLRRGLGFLSDEFAVADAATQQILPYRRSLHIRPGTPALIPELRFLERRPQLRLGGGIEWAVTPYDLDRALPGCLAPAAPLRYVILLDGAPNRDAYPSITSVPAALATMELLRGTWGASVDFAGGLARIGQLLSGARCARLRVGALEATLDCVLAWLEANHG
jgi:hypothetical protein